MHIRTTRGIDVIGEKTIVKRQRRRLYELTLWQDEECVYRSVEFCTRAESLLYTIRGYTVEDLYDTLDVDSEDTISD